MSFGLNYLLILPGWFWQFYVVFFCRIAAVLDTDFFPDIIYINTIYDCIIYYFITIEKIIAFLSRLSGRLWHDLGFEFSNPGPIALALAPAHSWHCIVPLADTGWRCCLLSLAEPRRQQPWGYWRQAPAGCAKSCHCWNKGTRQPLEITNRDCLSLLSVISNMIVVYC